MIEDKVGRNLNMEEKRKLEKIIFSDIDSAKSNLSLLYSEKISKQKEVMLKNPPKDVIEALKKYTIAKETMEGCVKIIEKKGYDVCNYREDKPTLSLSYKFNSKELIDLDKTLTEKRNKLDELKRSYTIKLFAGGAVASELFKNLAKELASIIK